MAWRELTGMNQPYDQAVSLGKIPGVSSAIVLGLNSNVSTTESDLSAVGGIYLWSQTVTTVTAVSDNVNDSSAGTGARNLFITGLDGSFNEISELLVLNGTTPVLTSQTFIRVNFVTIVESGTYGGTGTGSNIGTITLTHTSTANVIETILPQTGVTDFLRFTIPANKRALFKVFGFNVSSNKVASLFLHIRISADVFSSPYGGRIQGFKASGTAGSFRFDNENPAVLPPKTDIWVSSVTDVGTAEVNANITLELHPL